MRNPFQYGSIVDGESFCNREQEKADLLRAMENAEKLFVYSERRLGKTSLVQSVLRQLPNNYVAAYVDLWATDDDSSFAFAMAKAIAESMAPKGSKALNLAKQLFSSLTPSLTVDASGQPTVTFGMSREKDLAPVLEEVLTAPVRMRARSKKRPVIVFDEFQRIAEYESDRVERHLRSVIQHQQDVAYLFLGSRRQTIQAMFLDNNRPLYRSAGHYPLGSIAASHWVPFIQRKFSAGEKTITEDQVYRIHDLTQGHPFYTQHLCHALWEQCEPRAKVTEDLIQASVKLLLERENFAYGTLWDSLTNNQRRFLKGLATEPTGVKPFSSNFVRRYRLGSSSSAKRAAEGLQKRDIVDRENGSMLFLDRFFRLWVRELDS